MLMALQLAADLCWKDGTCLCVWRQIRWPFGQPRPISTLTPPHSHHACRWPVGSLGGAGLPHSGYLGALADALTDALADAAAAAAAAAAAVAAAEAASAEDGGEAGGAAAPSAPSTNAGPSGRAWQRAALAAQCLSQVSSKKGRAIQQCVCGGGAEVQV